MLDGSGVFNASLNGAEERDNIACSIPVVRKMHHAIRTHESIIIEIILVSS